MAAIFIESDNIKSLKLLADMAQQLGATVNKLSKPQTDNLHLGTHPKTSAANAINARQLTNHGHSANPFIALRKSIKSKMTQEQIDQQIKSLREEWLRDI